MGHVPRKISAAYYVSLYRKDWSNNNWLSYRITVLLSRSALRWHGNYIRLDIVNLWYHIYGTGVALRKQFSYQ